MARLLRSPVFGWAVLVTLGFALVASVLVVWARERAIVAPGQVAPRTWTVRVPFKVVDEAGTDSERQRARAMAPRVYSAAPGVIDEVITSIQALPRVLAAAETVETVEPALRELFNPTPEILAAVRVHATDDGVSEWWSQRSRRLADRLRRMPLVDSQAFQAEANSSNRQVELRWPGQPPEYVATGSVRNVASTQDRQEMLRLAWEAGFDGAAQEAVANRLMRLRAPTYLYDSSATTLLQDQTAEKVPVRFSEYPRGYVIYRRGEVLTQAQVDLFRAELREFATQDEAWRVWVKRGGAVGAVVLAAGALWLWVLTFAPAVSASASRVAALGATLATALAASCAAAVFEPWIASSAALAPTMLAAVLVAIVTDRRTALVVGSVQGILVGVAIDQTIGQVLVTLAAVGASVWHLAEVRHRTTLIRMGFMTALVAALATLIASALDRPIVDESLAPALWDAGGAAVSAVLVGFTALGVLPWVERAMGVTTGMTLIELRDPKQPLLRQLQQRAPGTYNHSLNVASLAEGAAEAIGADGLLTYVGALYHDIGKMNKPDYFVENQTPGLNRHEKLSPAMSLLVIVGHVKDGVELAREYNLPRSIIHFIEAHHGTTLVEYFYHRARQRAEGAGDGAGPSEVEYRYPGPRPKTKEVAILMLCDAVESAARSMADPTPARIDSTVRAIANKRLTDGQFDECDLSLRELNTVVETVARSLAAMYHGRIAYPTGGERSRGEQPRPAGSGDRVDFTKTQPDLGGSTPATPRGAGSAG